MEVLVVALYAGAFLLVLNVWTFFLFGLYKFQARREGWRIRESTLISLGFLGGGIGAKFGQRVWRHKTYKQPFGRTLNFAIFLNLLLIALVGGYLATSRKSGDFFIHMTNGNKAQETGFPVRFGPGSASDF